MGKKKALSKELSQYFSDMAQKSAKARLKSLTPEERKAIAANAARARWGKPKGKGQP